jgi:hypothetical protein
LDYNTSDSKWVFSGGYEVELFKAMSDYFNFTYKIINCYSDWGIRLPNKTWTGIIGSVASKVILENFNQLFHKILLNKIDFQIYNFENNSDLEIFCNTL